MKSEPDTFSLSDLEARPRQTEPWEGVRNYVARNHMRRMRVGDRALFYHSSCKAPGVVGVVEVCRFQRCDGLAAAQPHGGSTGRGGGGRGGV